jgi:imidazoleglycerol phosphate synthase glutamine amidotransferase subunit HisH
MSINLGWQKCAMKENGLSCIETKQMYLMLYFLHKYRIDPTAMQQNSLELVYDI